MRLLPAAGEVARASVPAAVCSTRRFICPCRGRSRLLSERGLARDGLTAIYQPSNIVKTEKPDINSVRRRRRRLNLYAERGENVAHASLHTSPHIPPAPATARPNPNHFLPFVSDLTVLYGRWTAGAIPRGRVWSSKNDRFLSFVPTRTANRALLPPFRHKRFPDCR